MPGLDDAGQSPLLEPDEPAPFELFNSRGTANALLVCDHASNRLPRRLGTLGLQPAQLQQHIAWDLGAAAVARGLAQALDASLILSGYSRLAIDVNRPLENPELIPRQSAGIPIPGNQRLNRTERYVRIATLFQSYHRAIARWLDLHHAPAPCMLSLHSFTPRLGGDWRPWDIGLCYGRDTRLVERLRPILQQEKSLVVGDNQPYAMKDIHDFTLPTHAETREIPYIMIEISQDRLQTSAQIATWIERLSRACEWIADG